MSEAIKRKRKAKKVDNSDFQKAPQYSNAQQDSSAEQHELSNIKKNEDQKPHKINEGTSMNKLKLAQQQTVGAESVDQSLLRPYQFLKFANPPLHTIFVPHFKLKSLNFALSIIFIICFVVLLIYSYTKKIQNKLTWNCSIFELQNKYFPRVRYNIQIWRAPISFFFHSNIAHFILNLIGVQIYGYFVEWYYGKAKYVITLLVAGLMGFVLSCVTQPTTVSTCASSLLFAIFALKLYFLYQYKDYKPLLNRKVLIYLLLALIFGINLIPIFVNNNVDFTTHIAGFVTGGLLGLYFHINKQQEQTNCKKFFKFFAVFLVAAIIIICITLVWALPDVNDNYYALNQNIYLKCNDPTQF